MATPRPPTPPHHPTHSDHFSHSKITSIISSTLPHCDLLSIEQLPSGKSFNSRIYFLAIETETRDTSGEDNGEDAFNRQTKLVLKVSGQFFGPDKVQNEVSCLWLLERYCPDVPAPRVIAWSEDGSQVRRSERSGLDNTVT